MGLVILYSSSMGDKGAHYLALQAVWGSVGVVACFVAAIVDYRLLKKLALPIFACAVLMLVGVLFTEGRNGSRRWFDLGFASFQPSEAAKLALIIVLAWYGEKHRRLRIQPERHPARLRIHRLKLASHGGARELHGPVIQLIGGGREADERAIHPPREQPIRPARDRIRLVQAGRRATKFSGKDRRSAGETAHSQHRSRRAFFEIFARKEKASP